MNKEQFFKDIDGTIMEDIFMVQNDDYANPESSVKPNEEILGHMTQLEKCIYTVLSDRVDRLASLFKKAANRLEGNALALTRDEFLRLTALFKERELLKTMLFSIIGSRLRLEELTRVGVRQGFIVVSFSGGEDQSEDPCATCPSKSLCDQMKKGNSDFCLN